MEGITLCCRNDPKPLQEESLRRHSVGAARAKHFRGIIFDAVTTKGDGSSVRAWMGNANFRLISQCVRRPLNVTPLPFFAPRRDLAGWRLKTGWLTSNQKLYWLMILKFPHKNRTNDSFDFASITAWLRSWKKLSDFVLTGVSRALHLLFVLVM